MVNIADETEAYIMDHPHIKHALKSGVINYSKLARVISKEKGIKNFEAILVAARRYHQKIAKEEEGISIMDVLQGSKLTIRSKIIVVILDHEAPYKKILELQEYVDEKDEVIHVVQGASAITMITTEEFLGKIEGSFKNYILKVSKDLVEIRLKSPIRLESVPGVIGYLYSLFGENGININETLSCWTDTIFVIKKQDLVKAMDILSF